MYFMLLKRLETTNRKRGYEMDMKCKTNVVMHIQFNDKSKATCKRILKTRIICKESI